MGIVSPYTATLRAASDCAFERQNHVICQYSDMRSRDVNCLVIRSE